jgi:hypothetical protein
MNQDQIDAVIEKLGQGWTLLARQNRPIPETHRLGIEVLNTLLRVCEEDGLLTYAFEQIIIKFPSLHKQLLEAVEEAYPQHKDFIQKLLVLA